MRQSFVDDRGSWLIRCRPGHHVIEGLGLVVFTPKVNEVRDLLRCCTDHDAQYFLRWPDDWVANVLGPDPRRVRYNLLPQPWVSGSFQMGVRRMGSREILATMWARMEGAAVDLSATKRPEFRRTGVATEAVFGAIRLLNRHFGVETITLRTASVNAAANATMRSVGFELIEEEVPRVSPGGIEYLENVFRVPVEGAERVCRWGIEFGRDGWMADMSGRLARPARRR